MKEKKGYVYIMANKWKTTMYIGVTSNLINRINEHKKKLVKGFSSKYNVDKLVYFEECDDIRVAIEREKQLKRWNRTKKNILIKKLNPEFNDLSKDWYSED